MVTARIILIIMISLVWAAAAFALDVKLQWNPNTESDLAGYKVYYGVNDLSTPTNLDVNNQTVATISGLDPAKNYSFAVVAYNASGLESPYSNVVTEFESVAPIISISNPNNNAQVINTVSVTANASDNVGVTMVEFYVNGIIRAAVNAAPYNFMWDTKAVSNGSYAITAKAYDAAGNSGQSSDVTVTVNNYFLADALLALRIAVKIVNFTQEEQVRMDVAPVDGTIDIKDALGILRDVVGIQKLVL